MTCPLLDAIIRMQEGRRINGAADTATNGVLRVPDVPVRLCSYLNYDYSVHYKDSYYCPVCLEKIYINVTSIKDHVRAHNLNLPYVCTVCRRAYNSRYFLVNHLMKHMAEYYYKCSQCSSKFSVESDIMMHIYETYAQPLNFENESGQQKNPHCPLYTSNSSSKEITRPDTPRHLGESHTQYHVQELLTFPQNYAIGPNSAEIDITVAPAEAVVCVPRQDQARMRCLPSDVGAWMQHELSNDGTAYIVTDGVDRDAENDHADYPVQELISLAPEELGLYLYRMEHGQ